MAKVSKKTTARKPKATGASSAKGAKRVAVKKKVSAKRQEPTAVKSSPSSAKPAAKKAANSAADVMSFSTDAMRKIMEQSGMSAALPQDQLNAFGQQSAEQIAKSAETASRSVEDMVDLSKKNADAAVKAGDIAVSSSKNMGAEFINFANRSFSQNVELSKELFGCRTLNDMFDLQSKIVKSNMDDFFSESVKFSEMVFQCAEQVSEPLNERVSETAERLNKTLSEAA